MYSNVIRSVDSSRIGVNDSKDLMPEVAMSVLEMAAESADGLRWWLALLCGLRQGEALGATIESILLPEGLMTVQWSSTSARFAHGCDPLCAATKASDCQVRRVQIADGLEYRQLGDSAYCLVPPKSGRPRAIPLIPQLVAAFERYFESTANIPNP